MKEQKYFMALTEGFTVLLNISKFLHHLLGSKPVLGGLSEHPHSACTCYRTSIFAYKSDNILVYLYTVWSSIPLLLL